MRDHVNDITSVILYMSVAAVMLAVGVISCAEEQRHYAYEPPIVMPQQLVIAGDTPPEMATPSDGRPTLTCNGVYMQCERRKTKTSCWCSTTGVK